MPNPFKTFHFKFAVASIIIVLGVFFTENYYNTSFNATFYAIVGLYMVYFLIYIKASFVLPLFKASKKLDEFQKRHYRFLKKATMPYPCKTNKGVVFYKNQPCFIYKRRQSSPCHFPDHLALPAAPVSFMEKYDSIAQKAVSIPFFYFYNDGKYASLENASSIKDWHVKNNYDFFDETKEQAFKNCFKPLKILGASWLYYGIKVLGFGLFLAFSLFLKMGVFAAFISSFAIVLVVRYNLLRKTHVKHNEKKGVGVIPRVLWDKNYKHVNYHWINPETINKMTPPIMLCRCIAHPKTYFSPFINNDAPSILEPLSVDINHQPDTLNERFFIQYNDPYKNPYKPSLGERIKEVIMSNDIAIEYLQPYHQTIIEQQLENQTNKENA